MHSLLPFSLMLLGPAPGNSGERKITDRKRKTLLRHARHDDLIHLFPPVSFLGPDQLLQSAAKAPRTTRGNSSRLSSSCDCLMTVPHFTQRSVLCTSSASEIAVWITPWSRHYHTEKYSKQNNSLFQWHQLKNKCHCNLLIITLALHEIQSHISCLSVNL